MNPNLPGGNATLPPAFLGLWGGVHPSRTFSVTGVFEPFPKCLHQQSEKIVQCILNFLVEDDDDDNDGIPDGEEDDDGDGIENDEDNDDDGDGIEDKYDKSVEL